MDEKDKSKFFEMMVGIGEYYKSGLSKAVLMIYYNGLKRYTVDEIGGALERFVSNTENGQFMPKIADIVKFIDGSADDKAMRAWTKLEKSAAQIGRNRSVCFDDPIIMKVAGEMGGWSFFCDMNEKNEPFIAKEFMSRYRNALNGGEVTDYPKIFIGVADADNLRNGFIDEVLPTLIGDEHRAKLVYEGGAGQQTIGFNQMVRRFRLVKEA